MQTTQNTRDKQHKTKHNVPPNNEEIGKHTQHANTRITTHEHKNQEHTQRIDK